MGRSWTQQPVGGPRIAGRGDARPAGSVTALDRRLVQKMLAALGDPPIGFTLWNGETIRAVDSEPSSLVRIRDRGALLKILANPALQFGEMFSEGRVTIEGDLVATLETVFRSIQASGVRGSTRRQWISAPLRRWWNSPSGSRRNIHHHYDIGNDFYALWLDEDFMQYTCAYFPEPGMTLEQAQQAKMHHVCRKLRLAPGQTVIEAGCGWGGFARFMARHYGVVVRAYNISREQIAHARKRAREEGLDDRVEYVEDDYRNIEGRCDAFVSVGMLEHVGPGHYRELGAVIDRCLAPGGGGLIHTIGRDRLLPLNPWIRKRIFPGAHPPTLREMMQVFEPHGFSILDVENLRPHYAETLRHWLERYEREADRVREGFGEFFVRAWRLYLAGSVAAFASGSLQLFQVVFSRPGTSDLPRSRAHLHGE